MSGLGFRVRVFLLFGLPPRRSLLMLVMLGLVSSVCVALPLPCVLSLPLSLSLSLTVGVLFGACSLLLLVGFFISVFFMVIRVLILILSSLL